MGVNYKYGTELTLTAIAIRFKAETSQADTRPISHTASCNPFYVKHKYQRIGVNLIICEK